MGFNIIKSGTSETIRPNLPYVLFILSFCLLIGVVVICAGGTQDISNMSLGIIIVLFSVLLGCKVISGVTFNFKTRQIRVSGYLGNKYYSFDEIEAIHILRSSDGRKSRFVQICVKGKEPFAVVGGLAQDEAEKLRDHIAEILQNTQVVK